jgi:glyoxylase-like metal-dependent hydrolase (beta-lactamase superfamily II)
MTHVIANDPHEGLDAGRTHPGRERAPAAVCARHELLVLDHTDWRKRVHRGIRHAGETLIQCGGHFPGSVVAHWAGEADGRGVLLTGDTIFVTPGEDRVTFVWSAPNRLPLPERAVRQVVAAVSP